MDVGALWLLFGSEHIEKVCLDSLADTDLHDEGQVGQCPSVYSVLVPPVKSRPGSHPSTGGCTIHTAAGRFVCDVEAVEGIEANMIKLGSQLELGENDCFRFQLRWKGNGRGWRSGHARGREEGIQSQYNVLLEIVNCPIGLFVDSFDCSI